MRQPIVKLEARPFHLPAVDSHGVVTKVTLGDGRTFELPTVWSLKDVAQTPEKVSALVQALIENTMASIDDVVEEMS